MATREEYIDKLESRLREWNEKIDELQEKVNEESQDLKAKLQERLETLREQRKQLKGKVERIKESESLEDIKKDTDKLWKDIKKGLSEIGEIVKG